MIIPRIKLRRRIAADTQNGVTEYVLTVYIDGVVAFNTETQQEEGDYTALPVEMFLYRKYNNRTDGAPVVEPVSAGMFVRLLEPADIDTENPVMFGTEKLRWGVSSDIRSSELYSTLMPSVSSIGSEVSMASASSACAPFITGSSSAYYKSRTYVRRSVSADIIKAAYANVDNMVQIFKLKYMAEIESISDGTGAIETGTLEI